jgi:transcriptional regulator with XRE-family HTH domain
MKISKKEKKGRNESFGLRFRLLMGYHDLTLKDIATATQNAVSTVSTWKNGRVPSSPQTIERLAKQFHVTPSFLLYGRHVDEPSSFQHDLEEVSILVRKGKSEEENSPSASSILLGDKIMAYLQIYIHRASAFPYLLEHMWIQIQKEFALEDISPLSENLANFSKKF